jgi:hypothetical protein
MEVFSQPVDQYSGRLFSELLLKSELLSTINQRKQTIVLLIMYELLLVCMIC